MMPENPNPGDNDEKIEAATHILEGLIQDALSGGGKELEGEKKAPSRPVFKNLQAPDIVNEINRFLHNERVRLSVPTNLLRKTVRQTAEEKKEIIDEELEVALQRAIESRKEELIGLIRTGQRFIWTYTVDGILTIGSGPDTKHSVLASGADLWAAGTVQAKLDPADDALEAYKSFDAKLQLALSKKDKNGVEAYKPMVDDLMKTHRQEWEKRGYLKDGKIISNASYVTAQKSDNVTIVVDFESGHYAPSKAWESTYEVWEGMGFIVEKAQTPWIV